MVVKPFIDSYDGGQDEAGPRGTREVGCPACLKIKQGGLSPHQLAVFFRENTFQTGLTHG
jgi:hypothetical protein